MLLHTRRLGVRSCSEVAKRPFSAIRGCRGRRKPFFADRIVWRPLLRDCLRRASPSRAAPPAPAFVAAAACARRRRCRRAGTRPACAARRSYLAARHAGAASRRGRRRRLLSRGACAPIRRTASFSTALSSRCWPAAKWTKRCDSPSSSSRPTRPIASRGWSLGVACAQAEAISDSVPADLAQSVRGPITDLTATLLSPGPAMAQRRQGRHRGHRQAAGPEWYALFKDLHAGLILDPSGNKKEAGKRSSAPTSSMPRRCGLVEAYGSWLSRNGRRTRRSSCLPRSTCSCRATR